MAPPKKKVAPEKSEQTYVTQDDFNKFSEGVMKALENIVNNPVTSVVNTQEQIKQDALVSEATSDEYMSVPPEWNREAKNILGDALDHCELEIKEGARFTVVIKKEFSNAPEDYLDRYKVDRRTREIGNTGIAGVKEWCTLISQNLKRGKKL